MTRNKTYVRGVVAVVGALALSALALPAVAANGDIEGDKFNDTSGPITDGTVVEYEIELENESTNFQDNVTATDTLPAGMNYLANSTFAYALNYARTTYSFPTGAISSVTNGVAKDELPPLDGGGDPTGTSYSSPGEGSWVGPWYEELDDANQTTGLVQSTAANDVNGMGFTGAVSGSGTSATGPALIRQFNAGDWVDLQLVFQSGGQNLDAGDTLGVWTSGDGSTWTHVTDFEPAAADTVRIANISGLAGDSSAYIRVGVSGTLIAGEVWSMDNVVIAGVNYSMEFFDNALGGDPDLANGTPASLISAADDVDLNARVTLNTSYDSFVMIFYLATLDVSAIPAGPETLTNTVAWSAVGDTGGTAQSFVDVDFEPELDVTVTSNGPVTVGQPIILTVVFKHGAGSDGSNVCVEGESSLTIPPGFTDWDIAFAGGDTDACLEASETWTLTVTYPPRVTAGTVPFAAGLVGHSANAPGQEDEVDINVNASTDVVVVLAETGPANGGLAGLSAALVALGATALVVARRRNA